MLVYAFNDSNSYLKKRMAMEMWVMYITNSHRITAHQGLVVRHRRMNELVMRASINRERSRQFLNITFQCGKRGPMTKMPTHAIQIPRASVYFCRTPCSK